MVFAAGAGSREERNYELQLKLRVILRVRLLTIVSQKKECRCQNVDVTEGIPLGIVVVVGGERERGVVRVEMYSLPSKKQVGLE